MPRVGPGIRSTPGTHLTSDKVFVMGTRPDAKSSIPISAARLYPHVADDEDGTDLPIVPGPRSRPGSAGKALTAQAPWHG